MTTHDSGETGWDTSVLLADRDADTRSMYAEYLNQLRYEVHEAEDGREALAIAISRRPSIVVTETRLPGMSGFELCRLLRVDELTKRIPILVVTGDALPTDARLAEAAGADTVLVKPCLPETLVAEIERVVLKSGELHSRSTGLRSQIAAQMTLSNELLARSHATMPRPTGSRVHRRDRTFDDPAAPPALVCPTCDRPLNHVKSHLGGVSARHAEQWDYYECPGGCGQFQYRHRTRKIRRVG